jgi:signal peptidase II
VAAAAWARALGVAGAVIAADQLSKAWVNHSIARGDVRNVFLGVDFVNVRNPGVAFGLLSGGRGLVLLLTAAALAALLAYFATHPGRPLLWLPTGLLVGGALGNLTDRLRGESVTDFIDLPLWPPFNVADVSITFGVLLLLLVLERREAPSQEAPTGDDGDPRPV